MSLSKPHQRQENNDEDKDNEKNMWHYFKKSDKDNSAKCLLCSNMLKMSKGSYKGLKVHLKTKHCIELGSESGQLKRPSSDLVPKASTSKNDPVEIICVEEEEEQIPKKKAKTIDSYFKKKTSMEERISRMVCKDGCPLSLFCTSFDLRYVFSKSGMPLPNSPNTIRSIVTNFSNTIKADMIIEFEYLKKQGKRFTLTFDEWTSQRNHRYLNLNVHDKEKHFNLGLIRIRGSCTADHTINLIKNHLTSFGLHTDTDVIGMTTDGASVMVKVGKLMPCYQQLCFAHGLQLAVLDILYRTNAGMAGLAVQQPQMVSDTEDDEATDDTDEDQGVTVTSDSRHSRHPPPEVIPRYKDLLQKVRKVVKLFKRSPTKHEKNLQKYVQEDIGKELSLILDCRTRWNSLLDMIERFYRLKVCVDKALIDIGCDTKFTDLEWSNIKDLIDGLQPFKLAVKALCRRDSTILTAETTLKFVLEKLDNQNSFLSAELSEALRMRIKERRIIVAGILIYLQNPKKYDLDTRRANNTFTMPKKNAMRLEMKKIIERLIQDRDDNQQNVTEGNEPVVGEDSNESSSLIVNLTLQEELDQQLQQESEDFSLQPRKDKDYEKILKKEMTSYESEGVRGKYLTFIYENLMSIKPTSVEAERAFSAAGYICSSLRSRLGDDTIHTICFLRSFFQNQK